MWTPGNCHACSRLCVARRRHGTACLCMPNVPSSGRAERIQASTVPPTMQHGLPAPPTKPASQAAQLPAGWADPQQLGQALQHSMATVAAFVFEDKLPSYQLQQAASEIESASSSGKIAMLHSLD